MPSLNFMKQFASKIPLEKIHTIRRQRKRPFKIGDTLYMFTGQRTKYCKRLGEFPCLYVADFSFETFPNKKGRIKIDNKIISGWYLYGLAINDGFDNFQDFKDFFIKSGLPFKGQIIGWREDINYAT